MQWSLYIYKKHMLENVMSLDQLQEITAENWLRAVSNIFLSIVEVTGQYYRRKKEKDGTQLIYI